MPLLGGNEAVREENQVGKKGRGWEEERIKKGREEGRREGKRKGTEANPVENVRVGKEIKLVATLCTPADNYR